MSSSNSRSGEMAQSGGDAVEKLKQLKRLKETYFLTIKSHRFLFRDKLVPLVRDWTKQLPNLLDIFTKQEMDWILMATVNSIGKSQKIIDFFIRCGYKDEPDLDEGGKPILLRTTAVNQIDNARFYRVHSDSRVSKSKVLENLFKIYDKFHVNYTDESGCTHFHMACKYGLNDVAEKFLELGQDPNCLVPKTGDSMLYFFVTTDLTSYRRDCSKEQIIRLLLKHGADPNLANKNGSTPFHGICQNDSFIADSVFLMLLKCIDELKLTVQINARDSEGNTPLHLATSNGSEEMVKLLLRRGADPCSTNAKGQTPLHVIRRSEHNRGLLRLFFELNDKHQPMQIDARDHEENTPLLLASHNGNEMVVESLLRRGADPCLANAKGQTPLHVICQSDHNEGLLRLFFKLNDELQPMQIDAQDSKGNTPLHLATFNGNARMVESLLRRGADPNLTNKDGKTPLHVICQSEHNEGLLRLFFELNDEIEKTVQLNIQDNESNTPLHLATSCGDSRMVELLLRRGADPCLANAKGLTPLHVICRSYHNEGLLWLFFKICDEIEKTVQLNIKDKKGNTPLHLATSRGDSQMVELLLRRGANPCLANVEGLLPQHLIDRSEIVGTFFPSTNEERQWMVGIDARDGKGRTALEWAVTRCWPHIVESLLKCGADVTRFVFPTPRDSDGYTDINRRRLLEYPRNGGLGCSVIKLAAATGLRAIVELLEERGYEMNRNDALKLMGFFDKYGLYESTDFSASEDVDNMVDSLFEVMKKNPTRMDDYKNASSYKSRKLSRKSREACSLRLCEKISIKFFRDWALDPFMELTHYRLPILCAEMIIENLSNKDLFIICLAAAGRSS